MARVDVQVRAARRSDLPAIVTIYNHYVEHSPATFEVGRVSVDDRTAWFESHSHGGPHRILVALDASEGVRGWASTSTFRPRAAYSTTVESSVYCRPDSVGCGIGARLYEELFRSIRSEDVARIVAGVTLPNPASCTLHQRFGFRPVGVFTQVGRKFGRYWDVAWFERPLEVLRPSSLLPEPSRRPRREQPRTRSVTP
jgi:phosphinothricin acetyltransferase